MLSPTCAYGLMYSHTATSGWCLTQLANSRTRQIHFLAFCLVKDTVGVQALISDWPSLYGKSQLSGPSAAPCQNVSLSFLRGDQEIQSVLSFSTWAFRALTVYTLLQADIVIYLALQKFNFCDLVLLVVPYVWHILVDKAQGGKSSFTNYHEIHCLRQSDVVYTFVWSVS